VTPGQHLTKRIFDVTLVLLAAPLLLPVGLAIAALVRWKLGSPVLFRQVRPGYRGRAFRLVKFRSMTDAHGPDGALLPDEARLPAFGRFLRSSSLDELPELWNVLKGEMSLVGPRPLLVSYLPRYSATQARRHETLPGITGWAQINGRNAIDWPERFRLDVWYVDNWSLRLDIQILLLTVWKVLTREGISAKGHATMPPFEGEASSRE
jgi:lipopolysaccharide/colanic/teichoic acid biosynthesis glycosyltransferase